MAVSLSQSAYAVVPKMVAYFLGSGGTAPYTYSVDANGAGGTVDSNGLYTAPTAAPTDPTKFFDTVRVADANNDQATARIQVGTPLHLLMEILLRVMSLSNDRVYLYNQKVLQPADSGLYIAVRVENSDSFANINRPVENGAALDSQQSVHMIDTIGFDLISRDTSALRRRGEFLRVWASDYAQRQQSANGFMVGKDPFRPFMMVPDIDGAAIPYRFRIQYLLQYTDSFTAPNSYFDTFPNSLIYTNP